MWGHPNTVKIRRITEKNTRKNRAIAAKSRAVEAQILRIWMCFSSHFYSNSSYLNWVGGHATHRLGAAAPMYPADPSPRGEKGGVGTPQYRLDKENHREKYSKKQSNSRKKQSCGSSNPANMDVFFEPFLLQFLLSKRYWGTPHTPAGAVALHPGFSKALGR